MWDIEAATEINSSISPYEEFTHHKAFVEVYNFFEFYLKFKKNKGCLLA